MILDCKLLEKLWTEILNTLIFLINISPMLTELFFKLLTIDCKTQTFYEAWHEVSYPISRYLIIIKSKDYFHIEDDKKVNSKKLITKSRKMIIIKY